MKANLLLKTVFILIVSFNFLDALAKILRAV